MKKVKRILALLVIVGVVSLILAGCKGKSDHPTTEDASEKVKSEEHPAEEHPSKEDGSKDEHPSSEHPAGEHPE